MPRGETVAIRSVYLAVSDRPEEWAPSSDPPEALVKPLVYSSPASSPKPSPVPTAARFPEWVQSLAEMDLWPVPGFVADAGPTRDDGPRTVPKGSYLKVLESAGDRFLVYHGGDDEQEAVEGWVSSALLSPSGPPRWVITRRATRTASNPGFEGRLSLGLPERAVLEVLEDSGTELRALYLGDGHLREVAEGWVQVADLGPAGAMLAGEARGVRLLGKQEVATLRSGGGLWLKVPYRSQLDGSPSADANCGPASVGMAMAAHGTFVPTEELRAVANKLQGTWGTDTGFAIEHLQGVVEMHGLRGQDLYVGKSFRRWTLEDVRRHLVQGHPVIPQLRFRLMPGRDRADYFEDHYVVLTGMLGDDFIYNDPVDSDGPGYGRLMSTETLVRAWGGSYFPFAAFAVSKP